MDSLVGVRVLLTGASSGIGYALASALAKQGAQLALIARRQVLLEELSAGLVAQGCEAPLVVQADLSVRGVAQAVVADVIANLGGVDLLVNNAGASIVGAQHIVGDDDAARTLFELNYWTPLALTAAVTEGMCQRGGGMVVNVTSTMQAIPLPLLGYYCSSKIAFSRATQVMRHELKAAGVDVMEVVPGGTDTPTRHQDELLPLRKKLPSMPLVAPEKTAEAIMEGILAKKRRVVFPSTSLAPLELPIIGRAVGKLSARFINAASDEVVVP